MKGINKVERKNNIIIEIREFSDELKKQIRLLLITICHGEAAELSKSQYHNFGKTLDELVNKRLNKDKNKKIGLIGELLLHVIIRLFTDLRIVSPFFNMEEASVKKGFDIIAVDCNKKAWFIEAKAGEVNNTEELNKIIKNRIMAAKRDLEKRLNEDNSQLWLNAINSVNCAVKRKEKEFISRIIEEASNSNKSYDKNVVLGGVVFCVFDENINYEAIEILSTAIEEELLFSDVKIIAIQKATYKAIYDYLYVLSQE